MSVPAEPALSDGVVILRPATPGDVDAAQVQRDELAALPVLRFQVEHLTEVAGTAEIRLSGHGNAKLSWAMAPAHRGQGIGMRAVRLLVRYAFEELGLHRVVAYVDPDDRASLRICGSAGLRREGLVRGARSRASAGPAAGDSAERDSAERDSAERDSAAGDSEQDGRRRDYIQLARLAADPEPTSGGGFIPVLNAGLPTKRVIAQGLIHNGDNEILLCELTYKKEWDLPGGVVDPHESPAQAVVREIQEELQVTVLPASLRAVNWLPPWRGWDDAMLFVFDLGVHHDLAVRARLEPREISALHWCSPDQVERHAAPYVSRMLRFLALQTEGTAYLEDGVEQAERR